MSKGNNRLHRKGKQKDSLSSSSGSEASFFKMGDFKEIVREIEALDFPLAVQKLINILHTDLVETNSRKGSVTKNTVSLSKNVMDAINKMTLNVFKELTEMRGEVKALVNVNDKMIRDISSKMVDLVKTPGQVVQKEQEPEFSLIITTENKDEDMNAVKKDIQAIAREKLGTVVPRDVIVTRNRQLILKWKNKKDLDKVNEIISENEDLRKKIIVKKSRRGRNRILFLGLTEAVKEEDIRRTLEDVLIEENVDFDIIKQIKTFSGNFNWLVELDNRGRDILVERKRLCVNFERTKVVDFINIDRCLKCQRFGHRSFKCDRDMCCVKCTGGHRENDCVSEIEKCINCTEASKSDTAHRADSRDCQAFQNYRKEMLSKRL